MGRADGASSHGLPTGSVTFLLTDVVGSTATWDRAPEAMAEALQRHDQLIADHVARCGGHLVKSKGEGDSTFNVFQQAGDAVRAAVEVQRAVLAEPWPGDIDLRIRAALHTGETLERGGDYYGGTVNRAARLRSIARGAEILVSETTATLASGALPDDAVLVDRGIHALRDLARPERVYAVAGVGLPDLGAPESSTSGDALRVPLPRRLAARTPFGYVGRSTAQARVRAHLDEAVNGNGPRLVVVSGEAGIGKTQLVCEVAATAVDAGVAVLYARCVEDGGSAYGPLMRLVEALVNAMPDPMVERAVDPHRAILGRVIPGLADGSVAWTPETRDLVADRYQLFHAVGSVLEAAAAITPLMLVIDDLQWADAPTLALLHHLVTQAARHPVLLVATARDARVGASDAFADTLATLVTEPDVETVELTTLSATELEELVRRAVGDELAAGAATLAAGLYGETSGHPFYTVELLRHLVERGHLSEAGGAWSMGDGLDAVELPPSVRDVIAHRVRRLGADAVGVLEVAGVIGLSFGLELLAEVLSTGEDEVLRVLEAAVDAALVREVAAERFAFAHGLVRSTVVAGLSPTRRAGVHRRIAEALAARDPDGALLGELAGHWEAAGRPQDLLEALDAARRAGELALLRLGPADAVAWFSRAADLAERTGAAERVRCEIAVRLGDAQRQAGVPDYRTTLLAAAEHAAGIGAHDLLVAAALANDRGFQSASNEVDRERVAVLERALDWVGSEDGRTRARIMATLANELSYSRTEAGRRSELAEEAVRLAHTSGDPRALVATVTRGLLPVLSPATLAMRLSWCREAEDAMDDLDEPVLQFLLAVASASTLVDAFEVRAAAERRDAFVTLADRLGQPLLRWTSRWSGVQIAVLEGRLDAAEEAMEEGLQLGTQAGEADALQIYAANMVGVRFAQGRLGELRELLGGVVQQMPEVMGFRILLALAHADDGAVEDAREQYQPLVDGEFTAVAHDPGWPSMMGGAAEIAIRLPGAPGAARLYDLLAPWREQTAAVTAMCLGAFGRQVGELAIALGRFDDAEQHLAWVADHASREGATVELARTWLAQARLAWERGSGLRTVVDLASRAASAADRAGATGVTRDATALLEAVGG